MIAKRLIALSVVTVMLSSATVAPAYAVGESAQKKQNVTSGSDGRKDSKSSKKQAGNFCATINQTVAKTTASVKKSVEKQAQVQKASLDRYTETKLKEKQARDVRWSTADSMRARSIAGMDAQYGSDPIKHEAIATFQTTLGQLVGVRRADNQKAREGFNVKHLALLEQRIRQRQAAWEDYQQDITASLAKAKASCETNATNSSQIRKIFLAERKVATKKRVTQLKSMPSISVETKKLVAIRKQAIDTNNQTFGQGLQSAKSQLQKALQGPLRELEALAKE